MRATYSTLPQPDSRIRHRRARDDAARRELARAFNAQRAVAQARLRDLLIHREAAGFRRNHILAELYPIPPALDEGRRDT